MVNDWDPEERNVNVRPPYDEAYWVLKNVVEETEEEEWGYFDDPLYCTQRERSPGYVSDVEEDIDDEDEDEEGENEGEVIVEVTAVKKEGEGNEVTNTTELPSDKRCDKYMYL
jgi:hypothetical protein